MPGRPSQPGCTPTTVRSCGTTKRFADHKATAAARHLLSPSKRPAKTAGETTAPANTNTKEHDSLDLLNPAPRAGEHSVTASTSTDHAPLCRCWYAAPPAPLDPPKLRLACSVPGTILARTLTEPSSLHVTARALVRSQRGRVHEPAHSRSSHASSKRPCAAFGSRAAQVLRCAAMPQASPKPSAPMVAALELART